ncbi:MAG TPA: SDR family NAD(P)-dependent oxidoreductase [Trebonia sp.]|nr:SDR family NAD(P)-dependent oxidoreductase [Trebonia sp.]
MTAAAAELNDIARARAGWSVTDVTDSRQVKAAVDAAVARFGRLDIVVANAGVTGTAGLTRFTLARSTTTSSTGSR